MTLPVIVLGGGGHAKVLINALLETSATIHGIVDADPEILGTTVLGVPVIGGDEAVEKFHPAEILLVNGIGSIGLPARRQQVFERFRAAKYCFATVIHPSAIIAADVELGEGAQIMAGVVLQPATRIGNNTIVNTRSSVDHDCIIGDHVHIAPGVTLSGGVKVGQGSHIGTGAVVIQGTTIGAGAIVAAGAVVTKDVPAGTRVRGVPARGV